MDKYISWAFGLYAIWEMKSYILMTSRVDRRCLYFLVSGSEGCLWFLSVMLVVYGNENVARGHSFEIEINQ